MRHARTSRPPRSAKLATLAPGLTHALDPAFLAVISYTFSCVAAKLGHVLRTPAKDYHESAARLSELIRTKLLLFSDLKQQPSRFFEAHRLLVNHGFEQGPGFSIRFTVQFNLFAGTVLELGGPRHLAMLDEMQEKGILGCFALTERLAGKEKRVVKALASLSDHFYFVNFTTSP